MCKVSTPKYDPPAKLARAKEPEEGALYSEAADRANLRGGGPKRSTMLTGLRGLPTQGAGDALGTASFGGAFGQQRMKTVLG